MMTKIYLRLLGLVCLLGLSLPTSAQRFFNLTLDEVSVGEELPTFDYVIPLDAAARDSVYTATLLYPEFVDMTALDVSNYRKLSSAPLPSLPKVETRQLLDRGKASLHVGFCPLVYRDGKYRVVSSFMLKVTAEPKAKTPSASRLQAKTPQVVSKATTTRATEASQRYAAHSVLASGRWAKIRVPASGVYQITDQLARQAGFSSAASVKVYGFGGNLEPEVLDGDNLTAEDDLKEVPVCVVGGRRLFYAKGPVSWASNTTVERTRNPYSDYGYYFLTSDGSEPATVDTTAFLSSFYPAADDYHTLYEVDGYSWYHGGRNLFDPVATYAGTPRYIPFTHPKDATSGRLFVKVSAGTNSRVQVAVNDSVMGSFSIEIGDNDKGNENQRTYTLRGVHPTDSLCLSVLSGGPVRLDYFAVTWNQPRPAPDLTADFPTPEYVYNITNQDHHADPQADMVIIIPTSQKLYAQARRLAAFHQRQDSLRINIVPADELYNEFSSGTPDASAYRHYMKMLYDRAETDADKPRFLLLFGDCVWDNRMLTSDCRNLDPNDYLLAYESENSFNEIRCYLDDGFFGYLDDGEGTNLTALRKLDLLDVAVGRFPVTTAAQAKIMVDKTIRYVNNDNAGSWQNTLVFMGDDGNANLHMNDENDAAEDIASRYPGYQIKKVMWDAYTEEVTSTGNSYPEITRLLKEQQQQGALIMDYSGHGRADQISHERVLTINDFKTFNNRNLPLWVTASCDIMAFDGTEETIGEQAVLNQNGGAFAFFGTTRTVTANYNKVINMAFLRYVLSDDNGRGLTVGEAARQAKNYVITSGRDRSENKLQYSLLGDPAVRLNLPTGRVVIDSINGVPTADNSDIVLNAGSVVRVAGHVEDATDFNGVITATVLDSRQLVTCRMNNSSEASSPFRFYNRTKTIFQGTDSIRGGRFTFSFAVPVDLNYANAAGQMCLYAINRDHTREAHGSDESFILGSASQTLTDSIGPKLFVYLNNRDFVNGGTVNSTPFFVAEISDNDGLNTTGNGIGHDLELIIDDDEANAYKLNDNFSYDFGSYTSGQTYYTLPALEPGHHTLRFRAWDILNNSSTATLEFNVVHSLKPGIVSIDASTNAASNTVTFYINHNFGNSQMDVVLDVFDVSGRQIWKHSESGVSTAGTYTVEWDLSESAGSRLDTGVYIYRARISSDGSDTTSKAKKLIIVNNN